MGIPKKIARLRQKHFRILGEERGGGYDEIRDIFAKSEAGAVRKFEGIASFRPQEPFMLTVREIRKKR